MATINKAALVAEIRLECGKPTQDELSDDELEKFLDDSVSIFYQTTKYSTSGILKVDAIVTIAGQQQYSLPTGAFDPIEVYWFGAITNPSAYYFSNDIPYITTDPSYGLDDSNFRSLQLIDEIKLKTARDISSRGANWDFIGNKVFLIPVPTTTGINVPMLYVPETPATATIDDGFSEIIKLYAAYKVLQALAAIRSNVGVVDREGISAYQNARFLSELADKKKEEWAQKVAFIS